VRWVRVAARLQDAQVILVSGLPNGEAVASRVGAQKHLTAPLTPRAVQAALAAAAARL
jgi:hypothetical protein